MNCSAPVRRVSMSLGVREGESQEEAEGGGPFEVMLTVFFRSDDISTE